MQLGKTARHIGRLLLKLILGIMLVSIVTVASLRWLDPPISAFRVQRLIEDWSHGDDEVFVYFDWVSWDDISPLVPLAVVAAEDQRFPQHRGFDLVEIQNALQDYSESGRLRGATPSSDASRIALACLSCSSAAAARRSMLTTSPASTTARPST